MTYLDRMMPDRDASGTPLPDLSRRRPDGRRQCETMDCGRVATRHVAAPGWGAWLCDRDAERIKARAAEVGMSIRITVEEVSGA